MVKTDIGAKQAAAEATALPAEWKVVIHDDDFTPMQFVSALVERVFNVGHDTARSVTLTVHNTGRASLGPYTKEVAISKAKLASTMADECDHPLLVTASRA